MSDTRHTPGPWIANRLEDGDPDTGPDGDYYFDGTFFALRDGGASTEDVSLRDEANARLVAAAPELLAAMIEAEQYVETLHALVNAKDARAQVFGGLKRMRAAIAKATPR